MIGRLKELMFSRERKQLITVEVSGDFRDQFDKLKQFDLDIEIKRHRERRSNDANAYFHVLVHKIAVQQWLSDDEVKVNLVRDYGALLLDKDGKVVLVTLPAEIDPDQFYRYAKCYETRYHKGKAYRRYLLYKQTHLMDSAEMSRLIDGAIYEARNLGIETDTPEQLARNKALWGMT